VSNRSAKGNPTLCTIEGHSGNACRWHCWRGGLGRQFGATRRVPCPRPPTWACLGGRVFHWQHENETLSFPAHAATNEKRRINQQRANGPTISQVQGNTLGNETKLKREGCRPGIICLGGRVLYRQRDSRDPNVSTFLTTKHTNDTNRKRQQTPLLSLQMSPVRWTTGKEICQKSNYLTMSHTLPKGTSGYFTDASSSLPQNGKLGHWQLASSPRSC